MTHKRPRVDRENELDLLLGQAVGQASDRVALVCAASGMGKSELLREFKYRCPEEISQVLVDFKGGGVSLAMVFFHVCDTLGGSGRFANLGRAIQRIVSPVSVNVTGNVQWGENDISVALGGPDEQTRDLRRADLTSALITDLREMGRMVLILDTYEKCDPELQKWIASALLPAVARSHMLMVIVAGQTIPETSAMWDCKEIDLQAIPPEYWHAYAHAIGVSVEPDFVAGCCHALKGNCLSIANTLESLGGVRA